MLSRIRIDNRSSNSHIWSSVFGLYGKAHPRLIASLFLLQVLKKEVSERAVRLLIFGERGGKKKKNILTYYLEKLRSKKDSLDMLERTSGICCYHLCCVKEGFQEAKLIRENNPFIQERKCNDTYFYAILPSHYFFTKGI